MPVVTKEIFLRHPPEQWFANLADRAGSFFLDSGEGSVSSAAYSFIGFDPFLSLEVKSGKVVIEERGRQETRKGSALAELSALLRRFRSEPHPLIPFSGGAVGFFSYDLGASWEGIVPSAPDDLGLPEMGFGFYEGVIAIERESGRTFAVANAVHDRPADEIIDRLENTVQAPGAEIRPSVAGAVRAEALQSNFTKADYLARIARIKDYIQAGDVYQINLAQRFECALGFAPYELYRRLRERSPAPFAGYLNASRFQIVSSSPESFLRIRNGRIETRPIKGTRRRGVDTGEDKRLRTELSASAKDRAELLMIVDLERNDLGRVCVPGSIKVDELFQLESHPTVHHLVATISGQLRSECDAIDAIRAAFPGGSITGAPKIRAMEIINELETRRRGVYTGSMGYLGFDGNCDLNIAIRTIVCRDGKAYYHVGGGVVWDSDPEAEYEETLIKGRAMRSALFDDLEQAANFKNWP